MRNKQKSIVMQPTEWLTDTSEMGERIRTFDWSATPLGPRSSWSPSLRMMIRFLLANRFPLLLWWGSEFIQIYNDPYRPVLGAKHPVPGLGRPVSECWSEIWHILRPLIETPFNGGPATWMEDIMLEINRHGFVEETHFTIAYSPVPDESVESGIGGVLATVHEISEKVVGERRMTLLRDLSARTVEARTAAEACAGLTESFENHSRDIPFALVYLIEDDRKLARLAGVAGLSEGSPISPGVIEFGEDVEEAPVWPVAEVVGTEEIQIVNDLTGLFGDAVPPGPWSDPPRQAVVAPIYSNIAHQMAGVLVVGVSSRLQLNDSYRSFIELLASQIATAIAHARAYEDERKRAEALAEIDRTKTAFFSNVSHEFRTPLTLMLGPLEEALGNGLPAEDHERLSVAHRNSLRLLKLVNTLLDFSRIEAGRIQAVYEPTDLGAYTAELASVFRAAIEKAGLQLIVDCPSLAEDVCVDRDMWEKVVLNLLSNAFKFTFTGQIAISLRQAGEMLELKVRDTGTGICASELPHIFERFHQVKGARGRSLEGSGIGLALVKELVKLHGGTVGVESQADQGSTFTVMIPSGSKPAAEAPGTMPRLSPNRVRAEAYVDEVLKWLPESLDAGSGRSTPQPLTTDSHSRDSEDSNPNSESAPRPRVLLADDNTDMREYVRRLLTERYQVEAVSDGLEALKAARERTPDLVLTDVMMPGLDGFGLIKELRADNVLKAVPVILLSARAGEEASVEGIESGADDYLIKPFSARELVARVSAHLNLHRIRCEVEVERELLLKREHDARQTAEEANKLKDQFLATLGHELRNPLNVILGYSELMSRLPMVADNDQLRNMVEAVRRNAQSQSQLISDLLDLSRLQMGKLSLHQDTLSLVTIINDAIETVREEAQEKSIAINISLPDKLLLVEGDSLRLQQVIWNLLNNAIKFTPGGGRVNITLTSEGDEAVIAFEDNGVGIAPDFLPHAFDMFRQADASTVRQHEGMGIGLALVQRLIQCHAGSVTAYSAGVGLGACFTIRLPLSAVKEVSATQKREMRILSLNEMKVLVVDDSEDTTRMLGCLLEGSGAVVSLALNGDQALSLAGRDEFDIIFSDISMPGMDGFELLRRLRDIPRLKDVPVLALTGFGQVEDIQRAKDAGFFAHIVKPIDFESLALTLESIRGPER
jgi:signal transduction histidine kinase